MIAFKGAIFDLDGTLIDSMAIWDRVGTDFLLSHGVVPPENIEELLKPMSFYQSAQYFIQVHQINYTAEQIMALVYEKVADQYSLTIPLKDSIKEYLEKLHRQGIKKCVATASNKELAIKALKRLEIDHYFEFVVTCDELNTGKEEPKIYLEAAKRLEIDPEEIVVFEDALYCVKTAKSAGFHVIGVYDKSSQQDIEALKKECGQFIMSFKELL
ncbi:MAG: putative haloacid dehalogenase, family protein [Clostridia bacterium]|jgi:HAD superfamily hydrolase (TIGR01509 family)|nr:putative haloacid dehalogenase, family protein [Clostridia bacterium]